MQAKGIVCLHDKIYTPQPSIPTFNYSFEGWAATSGVFGGNRRAHCAVKGIHDAALWIISGSHTRYPLPEINPQLAPEWRVVQHDVLASGRTHDFGFLKLRADRTDCMKKAYASIRKGRMGIVIVSARRTVRS